MCCIRRKGRRTKQRFVWVVLRTSNRRPSAYLSTPHALVAATAAPFVMAGLPTDYNKWEKINQSIEPDEDELALQRLKQQKANMSEEEVRRLHDCWEKPEFKAMFQEYADEVSDPKNKAEQEAYLSQCEAEQRAEERAKQGFLGGRSSASFDSLDAAVPGRPDGPDGSKLLKPNKGFVIKTWKREPGKKDFDRERGKLFINVCSHDEIDAPTSQDVTAPDGRQGQTWSMPHLCSPAAKEEKDKAGHVCAVIDIVFNTLVLSRIEDARMGERWKEMVCKTALEMVAKLHELDLDVEGYKVLGTKYFGPSTAAEGCSTLAWKPEKAFEPQPDKPRTNAAEKKNQKKKAGEAAAAAAGASGGAPNLPNMTTVDLTKEGGESSRRGANGGGGGNSSSKPAVKAGFLNKPAAAKPDLRAKATAAERERVAAIAPKVRAPKFTVVHRGVGDMSAAWNDSNLAQTSRPRELLVKVELPELSSAADIDLDITERRLELTHEGARYQLSLPLPFPVLSEQGSAKFDKAKHILSVTLPVAASAAPTPVWEPAAKGQTEEERAAEEAAEKARDAEERARKEDEQKAAKEAEKAAREAKLKLEEEERERRRAAAVAQAEREATRRAAAAAKAEKDKKRQANEAKAAGAATPAATPAIKSAPAPPPPAPPAPAPAPAPVDTTAANAAAAQAAAEAAAKKPADSSEGSDRGSESEWVNVSEAEAEAAKAQSPSKPEVSAKKGFPEAAKAPPKPATKVVDITEPPAAPTGQQPAAAAAATTTRGGVPAFSNGLLFELD